MRVGNLILADEQIGKLGIKRDDIINYDTFLFIRMFQST